MDEYTSVICNQPYETGMYVIVYVHQMKEEEMLHIVVDTVCTDQLISTV